MKEDLTQVPGVGPVTAQKLADAGILDVSELAMLSDKKVVQCTGFPLSRATAIRQNALEVLKSQAGAVDSEDAVPSGVESKDKSSPKRKADRKAKKGKKSKRKDKKRKKKDNKGKKKGKDKKKKGKKSRK